MSKLSTGMSALVFAAAVVVGGVGCHSQTSPAPPTTATKPPPDPYARTNYSIIWSDPAGLDLMSPEGTYVRASMESVNTSVSNGNRDAAIPGFWDSISGAAKEFADGFLVYGPDGPWVGIVRYQILEAADHGDRFEVTVCKFTAQLGQSALWATNGHPDGKYEYRNQGNPWYLTVQRSGDTPPPPHQSGPDTFGTRPVFGSWKTVDWHGLPLGESNPCRDEGPWSGEPPWPALPPDGESYVTTDIPSAPSYPGWSDGR
ncbi:hypothetical protein [Mycolicibacterium fortuitum]|uniref:hypothetical protein n=1 Tax=Mycolicibacterium fortuitum TaxID=1766 RepID=UPI002610AECF|nr:hypothetical protein [Mycolicibacterium fortuitum]